MVGNERAGARRTAVALCGALLLGPALGQDAPRRAGDVLDGVVGIESRVPTAARTAGILGVERAGSGVVIDGEGLIVTIGYLILEAEEVAVVLDDASRVPASVVAYDAPSGLGLVRAERPLDVRAVPLGDSGTVEPRDPVLIASRGGVGAVQPAIVVSRREFAGYWEYLLDEALYTAPAHPQFGGAALLDGAGRLIGVGSLAVSDALPGPRPMPGNVFVPVDMLKEVLPDLLIEGRTSGPPRPWLGVYADDALGPVVVRRIAEDGPAATSTLRIGDVVVGVADRPVTSLAEFYRLVWSSGVAGDTIELVVLRGDALERVSLRSADRYEWLAPGKE